MKKGQMVCKNCLCYEPRDVNAFVCRVMQEPWLLFGYDADTHFCGSGIWHERVHGDCPYTVLVRWGQWVDEKPISDSEKHDLP